MTCTAHNLKATLRRWNTPGTYLVIALTLIYFWPTARDSWLRQEPWIVAEVQVTPPVQPGAEPRVAYHARAAHYVRADWTAWVQVDDRRTCVGHGAASYGPDTSPLSWDWQAFFERSCPVPTVPFSVCVRYDAEFPSGVVSESGPYCSALYSATGDAALDRE